MGAVQITTQLTCRLGDRKRKLYKTLTFSEWNLAALMSCVVTCLDDSHLYIEEEEESNRSDTQKTLNVETDIQQPLYRRALHFLRLASLLQFHLFGEPLPTNGVSNSDYEEFFELCSYLNLSCEPKFDVNVDPQVIIGVWCREFRVLPRQESSGGPRSSPPTPAV